MRDSKITFFRQYFHFFPQEEFSAKQNRSIYRDMEAPTFSEAQLEYERYALQYNIDVKKTVDTYWQKRLDLSYPVEKWFEGGTLKKDLNGNLLINAVLQNALVLRNPTQSNTKVTVLSSGIAIATLSEEQDFEFAKFLAQAVTESKPRAEKRYEGKIEQEKESLTRVREKKSKDLTGEWREVERYFAGGSSQKELEIAGIDLSVYALGFTAGQWEVFRDPTQEFSQDDFEVISKLLSAVRTEIERKEKGLREGVDPDNITFAQLTEPQRDNLKRQIAELKKVAQYLGGASHDYRGLISLSRIDAQQKILTDIFPQNISPAKPEELQNAIEQINNAIKTNSDAIEVHYQDYRRERQQPSPDTAKLQVFRYQIERLRYQNNRLYAQLNSIEQALELRTGTFQSTFGGAGAGLLEVLTGSEERENLRERLRTREVSEQKYDIHFAGTVHNYYLQNLHETEFKVENWYENGVLNFEKVAATLQKCWRTNKREDVSIGAITTDTFEVTIGKKIITLKRTDDQDVAFIAHLYWQIEQHKSLDERGTRGEIAADQYEQKDDIIRSSFDGLIDMANSGDPMQVASALALMVGGLLSVFGKGPFGKYAKYFVFAGAAHEFLKEVHGIDVLQTFGMDSTEDLFSGTVFQGQLDEFDANRARLKLDENDREHFAIEQKTVRSLIMKEMNNVPVCQLLEWHHDADVHLIGNVDTAEEQDFLLNKMPEGVNEAIGNVFAVETHGFSKSELALVGLGLLDIFFKNVHLKNKERDADDTAELNVDAGRDLIEQRYLSDLGDVMGKSPNEIIFGELIRDLLDTHMLDISTNKERTAFEFLNAKAQQTWHTVIVPFATGTWHYGEEKLKEFKERLENTWGPRVWDFMNELKERGFEIVDNGTDALTLFYDNHKIELVQTGEGVMNIITDMGMVSIAPLLWGVDKLSEVGHADVIPQFADWVVVEVNSLLNP